MRALGEGPIRLDEACRWFYHVRSMTHIVTIALDSVRSLCLQALESLNDEPQQLAMIRLRERHYASPFNRSGYGDRGAIEAATIDSLRQSWHDRCRPVGSIVGVAGAVNPHALA